MVKYLSANAGNPGLILWSGSSLEEKWNGNHSSILAGESHGQEAGQLQSMGSTGNAAL